MPALKERAGGRELKRATSACAQRKSGRTRTKENSVLVLNVDSRPQYKKVLSNNKDGWNLLLFNPIGPAFSVL